MIQSGRRTTHLAFIPNDFTEAIPGTWDLTEASMIKCGKKNKHGGGRRRQLVELVCAMLCTEKLKIEKKKTVAEKTKSARLNVIHFAARAVGDSSWSAHSHWLSRVSAQYSIIFH